MPTNGNDERSGREIRLLVLVIVVSVAVLLVLARFRYPAADLTTVSPSSNPLERLAARGTFDDLAAAIATVAQQVGGSFVILDLGPAVASARPGGLAAPPRAGAAQVTEPAEAHQLAAALRVSQDLAIAYVPDGWQITGFHGETAPIKVTATDSDRHVALVRVSEAASAGAFGWRMNDFWDSSYVALVEPGIGGPSARPVFIGRVDAVTENAWNATLLVLGGRPDAPAGAFLFALDGRFIGLTVRQPEGTAVVGPAALDEVVTRMTAGRGGS